MNKKFLINSLLLLSVPVACHSEQNQKNDSARVKNETETKQICSDCDCQKASAEQEAKKDGNQGIQNTSQKDEQKTVLSDNEKRILDTQIEHNLNCQRKLRVLINPLIEKFTIENFEKIEKFKDNEQEITAAETALINDLVTDFCQKNSDTIASYAVDVYEVSPEPQIRESFLYAFKKSFMISFKEEFINYLEVQRRVLRVKKGKI